MEDKKQEDKKQANEDPYEYALRMGQIAARENGDWRDNPYTMGTKEWFAFNEGLEIVQESL